MHIEFLSLRQFRNLVPLDIKFSKGTVFIRGDNGQGKTNLLEAIYFCATGKSFRRATHQQIIAHHCNSMQLKARIERQSIYHDIEIGLEDKRRSIQVDGRGIRKTSSLFELLNIVAFFPDDLRIIKGSPEERRRFLDRFVANQAPSFLDAHGHYTKLLTSRNALLKAQGRLDPILLESYDEGLIEHGAQMHMLREQALEILKPKAQNYVKDILGGETASELGLESGLKMACEPGDFKESFRNALRESFPKDRARGITSVGPHRADLLVELDGVDARHFASQGQQRALILAMKLGEVEILTEHLQAPPILLLDDVSSELDTRRTQHLFSLIRRVGGQVFVTTTGAADLPSLPEDQSFYVRNGCVEPAG